MKVRWSPHKIRENKHYFFNLREKNLSQQTKKHICAQKYFLCIVINYGKTKIIPEKDKNTREKSKSGQGEGE